MKNVLFFILIMFVFISCDKKESEQVQTKTEEVSATLKSDTLKGNNSVNSVEINIQQNQSDSKTTSGTDLAQKYPLITFVELGSVNCIPCKKMQPVMESLEKKYGEQLKVIFYDVWKKEYKSKSEEYGIKLIPTQVFLDKNGKEVHRHEGFYPEEEIDKFLQSNGLKILSGKK
jgi:thioredoxin 1